MPDEMQAVETSVTYVIEYRDPVCFDDGGMAHDQWYESRSSTMVGIKTDQDAQLESLDPEYSWNLKEHCYHGRQAYPTAITKKVDERGRDGWERHTSLRVPLPREQQCACGTLYWPIKGETACHQLLPASQS